METLILDDGDGGCTTIELSPLRRCCEEERSEALCGSSSSSGGGATVDEGAEPQMEGKAPVEERLLNFGREYEARRVRCREAHSARRLEEEAQTMQDWTQRVAHRPGFVHPQSLRQEEDEASARPPAAHRDVSSASLDWTYQPKVCPKSAELVDKRRKDGRAPSNGDPHTALTEWRRQADDRAKLRAEEEAKQYTFTPAVTRRAKEVVLPLTASERLYEHAVERHAENDYMLQEAQQPLGEFKPKISSRAAKLVRKTGHTVHDDLHRYSYRSKVDVDGDEERARACSFKPALNARSKSIANSMKETSSDRLLRPRSRTSSAKPEAVDTRQSALSPDSHALLYERQQLWLALRERKLREAQAAKCCAEESSCTFKPTISSRGRQAYSAGLGSTHTMERSHSSNPQMSALHTLSPSQVNALQVEASYHKRPANPRTGQRLALSGDASPALLPRPGTPAPTTHSLAYAGAADVEADFLSALAGLEQRRSVSQFL